MQFEGDMNAPDASEHAYRRGFIHGYCEALDHLIAGRTKQDMTDHVNTALREWREGDCSQRIDPPAIQKPK